MPAVQLELDFKQQLLQAQSSPQDVNWEQLCFAFDAAINQAPLNEQLALAADAIYEMAELHALRADTIFEGLRYSSDQEPVLSDDFLSGLVIQERPLDLGDLIAEPELYVRTPADRSDDEDGTVVEYRDKTTVLAELESDDQDSELTGEAVALKVTHVEDVGLWVSEIREYLEGVSGAVSFEVLVNELRLPVVAVLIGVLLGGFRIEQRGGFYDRSIWIGYR